MDNIKEIITEIKMRLIPLSTSSTGVPVGDLTKDAYNLRNAFYTQLKETNPALLNKIFGIASLSRTHNDAIDNELTTVRKLIERGGDKLDTNELRKKIQDALLASSHKPLGFNKTAKQGGAPPPSSKTYEDNIKTAIFNNADSEGTLKYKFENAQNKDEIVERYYKHPYYSPNNEKAQLSDRAVFIALTFIIRGLSLFIAEWSIFSGYVSTFSGAFTMYFGIYLCIFTLLIFITNINSDDMIFKMIFFYINTDSERGTGILRIMVHILCIVFILPIPYIVKEYRIADKRTKILTYTEKAEILTAIDTFTLYVWVLTSIVALNL